jgi:hypothetical protein
VDDPLEDFVNTLDPLAVSNSVADTYRRYLSTLITPSDSGLARGLETAIEQAARDDLTKGPFLHVQPPYSNGASLRDLIEQGLLSDGFARLGARFPLDRPLYAHQEQAIRKVAAGRNVVVATGTGSGKTESFLLPILDAIQRQAVDGVVGAGVRALLLYPMNALANDQLKRLRLLLADLPEITFGRYTGDTPKTELKAVQAFKRMHVGEKRLPNELLSREAMQASPPHLLLTNYAMLEYLLLRPADMELFGQQHDPQSWQFIVVDEAHVYDGATGAEVGFLLRRLQERVAREHSVQCIATSATVGSDHHRAAMFASDLFGTPFEFNDDPARQDVITATREPLRDHGWGALSLDDLRSGNLLGAAAAAGDRPQNAFDVLSRDSNVIAIKRLASEHPRTLAELASLSGDAQVSVEQLAEVVQAASQHVDENGEPVLSAKYHLFARATEGAFSCFSTSGPHVALSRRERCDECEWVAFEIAACRNCGSTYLCGSETSVEGGRFFSPKNADAEKMVWLALQASDPEQYDEDDVVLGDDPVEQAAQQAKLCGKCGRLSLDAGNTCSTPTCASVAMMLVERIVGARVRRCLHCGTSRPGVVRRFESGNDAAVSVLTTALYEHLPAADEIVQADQPGGGRKLLVFSDSRQQAAFFAPYLEDSHLKLLRRRVLLEAVARAEFEGELANARDIATEARQIASTRAVFASSASQAERQATAETWVQAELLSLDDRMSLEGTGLLTWRLKDAGFAVPSLLLSLGLAESEARDLLQALFGTLRRQGAVAALPRVDLRDSIFEPRLGPIYVRQHGSDRARKTLSWNATRGNNRRTAFLKKVFASLGVEANTDDVMGGLWRMVASPQSAHSAWLVTTTVGVLGSVNQLDPTMFVTRRVRLFGGAQCAAG